GVLEEPKIISDLAHRSGALLIACVDPISLGALGPPGEYGADLAVGDGQPLGIPLSFGGPYVGFIACTEALMRRMPGRLVGATVDADGRRGYVLTLQAREQHIRREHATSNITTNHALMAIAATVYLAHMGGEGLKQLAELSAQRAHHLAAQLVERKGYRLAFDGPFLWEFVMHTPYPAEQTQAFMLEREGLGLLRRIGRMHHELPEKRTVKGQPVSLAFYELRRQVMGALGAQLGELLQALATHVGEVDRSGDRHQRVIGRDVRGGVLAPDVLLAGLQRQHIAAPAVGVDRRPDQPPGHSAHQRLRAGDEADVGPAERERNAQRL